MLHRAPDYMRLRAGFSWRIPEYYNIADDICDRHAAYSGSPALIVVERGGQVAVHTFDDVRRQSNRLANVLLAHGARRTDRLAILLPQAPETLFAHVAAFKAGLVSVPLFSLFGADALEYRLANSGARFLVTDEAGLLKIEPLRGRLPELRLVLVIGDPRSYGAGTESFTETLARASDRFVNVRTRAEDPALIIYTSGTTGNPRGALHAHRVLLGHLPGVELSHDFFPQAGDVAWTPADWAWIGGLLDILLPSLHHGIPVVAYRARKFDPEEAYWLMASRRIRNVFLPPTALKLMRQADARALGAHRIRSVASGGEPLGDDLLEWGRRTFGVTINEFYGQTECNMVVCNDAELFAVKPGSMGRAVPGHDVRVVDETGNPVATGATGMLGIRRPDPVMFLGYWRDDAATTAKYAGDFLLTGDHGREDEDGYLWFEGRSDDLITSAGYRIGPVEIEECLLKHPAVAIAAVVGVPDPVRTQLVKAVIVLGAGAVASPELAREIQEFVKLRLAAHEYPRIVEFVAELPLTISGKIMRRELRAKHAAPSDATAR